MTSLLNQAPEVLHDIFFHVEPSDLASVAQTCRFLNTFIENDTLLWRQQYLSCFDQPQSDPDTDPQWSELLKANISVQKLLQSDDEAIKNEPELERVARLAIDLLLKSTPDTPKNAAFLRQLFSSNESSISSFLCRSSLFQSTRLPNDTPASTAELRQLSAQLHVFSGMEVEPPCHTVATRSNTAGAQQVHPYARSRVYDLRRYKRAAHWGPFLDDGSSAVDWEKVQAIMLVLAYNVRMYGERGGSDFSHPNIAPHGFHRRARRSASRRAFSGPSAAMWDSPFWGLAPNSYVSQPLSGPLRAPPNPDLDALDPYGVTGTWMRIVCFLDYSDLYNFNFNGQRPPEGEERGPIDTREAFRLIRLKMHVTAVEEPEEGDHPDFPVVKFEGLSRSTLNAWDPNANSRIRGTVRTTPTGAIRWTSFSIFHGEERWRSEGVQIGGPRSARGILGNWFDKDYDAAGPAGPTCFWKVSDDVVDEKVHGGGGGVVGLQLGGGNGVVGLDLGHGASGDEGGSDDDEEEIDDDDDDDDDGEGQGTGGGGGGLTLADLGLLGGQAGGAGLVVPLHEVVNVLYQALNGGGGGEGVLRLEDLEGLLD
ncbi:uncharacterized protein HMPREF1541_01063 [Cyphellophora europaea CBS 101466]|uniref:F-box domain-containing protein n=1 Tax=Cyphellophora europaea (strain CBS 101466) TaxID=1220924 RepID=W2SG83_CYPE1|nr:uncharacterized protein HMPREF1541_01063 [Cyphellophora europaea CBS 101466]ETN46874.1 hypothetical protein HMPREF1541_01063 [Cyphellophora europaea CBS 101466]